MIDLLKAKLLSVRSRILVFTLTVTLLPAGALGWLFYVNSFQVLEDKSANEMQTAISQVQGQLDLWLRSVVYELRVFSGSFVLTDSLKKNAVNIEEDQDIRNYLKLLLNQYPSYKRLILFGQDGDYLLSAGSEGTEYNIAQVSSEAAGSGHVAGMVGEDAFLIAIPVLVEPRTVVGWLGLEVPLQLIATEMDKIMPDDLRAKVMLLVDGTARLALAEDESQFNIATSRISPAMLALIMAQPGQITYVTGQDRTTYIAIGSEYSEFNTALIMLRLESDTFSSIYRLRNQSLLVVGSMFLIIGGLSYLLGQSILRPLYQLKEAALHVSEGNLDVNIKNPPTNELGMVMSEFNSMVVRLKYSREELELLSVTDPLTGLSNRKRALEVLADSAERYKRYQQLFSVLMIDIDHFKQVNDQYGHQFGDFVLEEIGKIFLREIRNIDTAARYGGEEFLIVLNQSNAEEAVHTAERIRKSVENHLFQYKGSELKCTLSIGVATATDSARSHDVLIGLADKSLYSAKNEGRNRVRHSDNGSPSVTLISDYYKL